MVARSAHGGMRVFVLDVAGCRLRRCWLAPGLGRSTTSGAAPSPANRPRSMLGEEGRTPGGAERRGRRFAWSSGGRGRSTCVTLVGDRGGTDPLELRCVHGSRARTGEVAFTRRPPAETALRNRRLAAERGTNHAGEVGVHGRRNLEQLARLGV